LRTDSRGRGECGEYHDGDGRGDRGSGKGERRPSAPRLRGRQIVRHGGSFLLNTADGSMSNTGARVERSHLGPMARPEPVLRDRLRVALLVGSG
jgi:hypothetical protein